MPRVVPSQVVSFINQTFPWLRAPGQGNMGLNWQHAGEAAGLLRLVDEIPNELLIMGTREYTEFVCSIEAIRNRVALWQNQQNPNIQLNVGVIFRDLHPVTVICQALAQCPDESPAPSTSELTFISDPDLKSNLRNDIGAVNRALSNGEWKAATVLAGSVIEALLLWALQQRSPEEVTSAVTTLRNSGALTGIQANGQLEKWRLHEYVEVAEEIGIIKRETGIQSRLAKDFRNLIHPGRALRLAQTCDRATALSAVAGVEHVVRDLTP
jgi:hypothetical protein